MKVRSLGLGLWAAAACGAPPIEGEPTDGGQASTFNVPSEASDGSGGSPANGGTDALTGTSGGDSNTGSGSATAGTEADSAGVTSDAAATTGLDGEVGTANGTDGGTPSGDGDATDGGPTLLDIGCADGEREAFVDLEAFPGIAGCAGGWSIPGIDQVRDTCGRAGGDDGNNPTGASCSPQDLCVVGWHVCVDAQEVDARSDVGCGGVPDDPDILYVTRQSGPGAVECGAGVDDVFGCGTFGRDVSDQTSCNPLDRLLSDDLCQDDDGGPWLCADEEGEGHVEATVLAKPSPEGGGVLCCVN